MTGTLYLVGVGPGDPELLTLKAARLLADVPVIAFPLTQAGPSRALAIADRHVPDGTRRLPLALPIAVAREPARRAYDAGAAAMLAELQAGRDVAFLCEGDPLFYGSAMYLLARVQGEAPVVVVPGVTSLTAAAAVAHHPLAARNEVLKVLPAPLPDDVLLHELRGAAAVAIIKLGRHFGRVRQVLERSGHAGSAVLVSAATTADEAITPLRAVTDGAIPYFSIILCYAGDEDWQERGNLP